METRGTAFVIYENKFDAKNTCAHLSGFNDLFDPLWVFNQFSIYFSA